MLAGDKRSSLFFRRESDEGKMFYDIRQQYVVDENSRDFGFIVFVSESPECKMGMFPPIMTLCDFDIEAIGNNCFSPTH